MCDFVAYEIKDKWRFKHKIAEEEEPELEKVQEQPITMTQ
jgi:hypothetical protein